MPTTKGSMHGGKGGGFGVPLVRPQELRRGALPPRLTHWEMTVRRMVKTRKRGR
jgi:hypothetical protein